MICEAWKAAENELVSEVGNHNPGIGEEGITERLFVLLQMKLKDASDKGIVENAFVEDMHNAHPDIPRNSIENFSQGLIAEALHSRYVEGRKTAGDFGLVMSSPEVTRSVGRLFVSKIQNGLLCQAKLKRKTWGQLTKAQIKILPQHLDYSALALYCYTDTQRRELCIGKWFSCKGSSVDELNKQFKSGFDSAMLKNSTEILKALAGRQIGTQKPEIIDSFIAPEGSRHFELHIGWKDRDECHSVLINTALKQEQTISLGQG